MSQICFCFCRNFREYHELCGIVLFYQIFEAVGALTLSTLIAFLTGGLADKEMLFWNVVYVSGQLLEIALFCYFGNEINYSVNFKHIQEYGDLVFNFFYCSHQSCRLMPILVILWSLICASKELCRLLYIR